MNKLFISILAVLCGACAPVEEPASPADIEAVLNLYVQAVNEGNYELLQDIWVPSNEISYINPIERLQTAEQLKGFWLAGISERFSERDLRPSNVSIHTGGGGIAWAVFDWEFRGILSDGQPFHGTGWETQIYKLTDRGWRIAHIQFSSPPLVPDDQA